MQSQGTPLLTRLDSALDGRLPLPRLLKLAFLCGALPLVTGTLVFLTWLVTRWDWLMPAGLITIFLGLVCFVLGAISLSLHLHRMGQIAPPERRRQKWLALIAVCILLFNFPVAWFCMTSASDIQSRSTVAIVNQSNSPVLGLTLIAPDGRTKQVPSIPASEKAHEYVRSFREGEIKFTCAQPSITNGLVESYDMGGGSYILVIKADGTYSVERRKG